MSTKYEIKYNTEPTDIFSTNSYNSMKTYPNTDIQRYYTFAN